MKMLINKKFLIILFIVIVLIFFLFVSKNIFSSNSVVTNINDYEHAKKIIKNQNYIQHFPKFISVQSTDTKLYSWSSEFDGELIILQLKIDRNYIMQELKKNDFINENSIVGDNQKIYHFPKLKGFICPNKYTFYVLKNENNKSVYPKYFPYFNGIGVDSKYEHIIYYYIEPRD